MADPRRAITVVPSRDAITGDRAPRVEKYYYPLDFCAAYRFAPGDTSDTDGRTTLGSAGGPIGKWLLLAHDDIGEDLADSDATIQLGDGFCRYIQPGMLTGDITITLGTMNARPKYALEIVRLDVEPYTVTIVDGFAGGATLAVMPVSVRSRFVARVNDAGTHWIHRESHLML